MYRMVYLGIPENVEGVPFLQRSESIKVGRTQVRNL
jgi:hypothetical protein